MLLQFFCHSCGNSFTNKPNNKKNGNLFCSKSCATVFKKGISPLIRFYQNIKKPIIFSECWEWTGGTDSSNYGRLFVDGRNISAHRYSYIIHIGIIDDNLCILHKCNFSLCVNPSHLYMGTKKENTKDLMMTQKYFQITPPSGDDAPWKKLSFNDVEHIRSLKDQMSGRDIAKRFNVSPSVISAIFTERIWRNKDSSHKTTSILSAEDVRAIRLLHSTKSMRAIAEKYNVTRNTIANIVNNRTWRHIS